MWDRKVAVSEVEMARAKFAISAFFAMVSAAQAASVSLPKPPPSNQGDITNDECVKWKAAIGRGYTLNPEEQSRYSGCVFDSLDNGGVAPGVKVYQFRPSEPFKFDPFEFLLQEKKV